MMPMMVEDRNRPVEGHARAQSRGAAGLRFVWDTRQNVQFTLIFEY